MMKKIPLGNTGIKVSQLGLGTVKIGRNQGVKYPASFSIPSDAEVLTLLSTAQDLGINLIDTAPAYGNSEERLGQLFGNTRKDWVIVTKVGEEFINGDSEYNFTPEHAQFSIERSLKRLRTDYLDAVLVHSDGNDIYNMQHFGLLDFLADAKKQGHILSYGVSSKTIAGGLMAVDKSDMVMVTYNPINTEELPIIQHAHKHNKGVLIKKALASGHIQKIAATDPVRESLQFIINEPGVTSIIAGTINPKHLIENVKCL
jgi:aryl-alcohol dehydrogenase-like predicted oxidoreductase